MKTIDCVKRDNLLVEYLLDHKGIENAVTGKEIAKYLTEIGFPIKSESVHCMVSRLLMERHLPICSSIGKGYYCAKNKQDIIDCIYQLQAILDGLQEHINHLMNFIIDRKFLR